MNKGTKAIFIHFFSIVIFIVAALAYFYPVLQSKTIQQSDIIQFTGMAKEQNDFRKKTGEEPYWTNSAFGGMPTYQLGAYYPHDYVKKLDRTIRFLPRPADYLFLYFVSFYILLCSLKVDYRLSILGALAFGFSTYLIIILGVGHNAKAHAIGFLPILLAGIILTFRKNYVWGFLLTAVAMALEVGANHYQMTYYFMLLVLIIGIVYLFDAIKNRTLVDFLKATGLLLVAVVLGIATNATSLMATKEYADWSTRGKSALTIDPAGNLKENKSGLDREYITQYSYGIVESLNLLVPRLFGGSNSEDLGDKSKAFDFLIEQGLPRTRALEFSSGIPLYWGKQPGVAGPAYIGALVVFLGILALFLVKGRLKWWLLGGLLMSLMLSWGKNFGILTNFMIDYFPLYNKFRAVSSIQVILELCAPILAILGLKELFSEVVSKEQKLLALKKSLLALVSVTVALFLFKGMFDFIGANDATYQRYFGEELMAMILRDREAVYTQDTIRTLLIVLVGAGAIYLYLRSKLSTNITIGILGVILLFDMVGVDLRYVNSKDFVRPRLMSQPFVEREVDKEILKDKSIYRVYDPSEGLNGARTSYFHKSIGGYHAAKPAALQDLFDYQIYKNNFEVLNMLNVKYIIQQDSEGQNTALANPDALGNAWFVETVKQVYSADDEIMALDSLNFRQEAVVNSNTTDALTQVNFTKDSLATIDLVDYSPRELKYLANNKYEGLAIFSEIYYPKDWQCYIDGKTSNHFKVNYLLRGVIIPAGEHEIIFRFEPEVVQIGSKIALASSVILILLLITGSLYRFKQARTKDEG
ncbi:YfhO family protein [Eudoraea chungangensis]|uniref:YfhO family protein n=1 Tax=Eudoraea chungangensis TaxID=1481905 RepID=UPI0023ECD38E|nr:YfhO family protein [Eudoraea chungangensis]